MMHALVFAIGAFCGFILALVIVIMEDGVNVGFIRDTDCDGCIAAAQRAAASGAGSADTNNGLAAGRHIPTLEPNQLVRPQPFAPASGSWTA